MPNLQFKNHQIKLFQCLQSKNYQKKLFRRLQFNPTVLLDLMLQELVLYLFIFYMLCVKSITPIHKPNMINSFWIIFIKITIIKDIIVDSIITHIVAMKYNIRIYIMKKHDTVRKFRIFQVFYLQQTYLEQLLMLSDKNQQFY